MATIDNLISLVNVAAPIKYRALSVFALNGNETARATSYLVLDEALATGAFRVTEVSEIGSVPKLLAINDTDSPVLLLDGEELVGAKQNRVINLSIMVAPKSRTEIPVSCVEAGRWRSESDAFHSEERVQFARARAEKINQVSWSLNRSNLAASDQGAVWDAIAAKSSRMRVKSPTGAMAEIYESRRDDLKNYIAAIPTSDSQLGAVYAIGSSIVGLELFDAHGTYRNIAPKLLMSYALDAMEEIETTTRVPDPNIVQGFIEDVRSAQRRRFMAVGMGESVRLSGDTVVGAALEVEASCIHLSVFRRQGGRYEQFRRGSALT
jgi:hypothetical protein